MPKSITKSKRGFTIIEVVLVLAIAGLIFMMVFIALPALQRSQRDTQRTNDISRLVSQLTGYSANNRGRIPKAGSNGTETVTVSSDTGAVTGNGNNGSVTTGSWAYFYKNYLLAGGDTFEDPSSGPYQLKVAKCTGGTAQNGTPVALTSGEECSIGKTVREGTFDSQVGNGVIDITILTNAHCEGELAVYDKSSRKVAVILKKEGGGTICENN